MSWYLTMLSVPTCTFVNVNTIMLSVHLCINATACVDIHTACFSVHMCINAPACVNIHAACFSVYAFFKSACIR